jgi:hypothetical protein
MGTTLCGGSLGNLGWAHLPGLQDIAEGALGMECLSLWGLCEGNLEGGLPHQGPWTFRKGSWDGHLFIGAPVLENLEEGLSTGDFKSWMKGLWGWGIALPRGSMEGASGRAPFTKEPKR